MCTQKSLVYTGESIKNGKMGGLKEGDNEGWDKRSWKIWGERLRERQRSGNSRVKLSNWSWQKLYGQGCEWQMGRCRESSQCQCCFLLRPLLAQVCCFPKEAGSRRGISLVPAHTECLFRPVLLLLTAAWAKARRQEGYRTMVVSWGGGGEIRWLENGAKEGLEGTGQGWELDVQFQEGGHGKERWACVMRYKAAFFLCLTCTVPDFGLHL